MSERNGKNNPGCAARENRDGTFTFIHVGGPVTGDGQFCDICGRMLPANPSSEDRETVPRGCPVAFLCDASGAGFISRAPEQPFRGIESQIAAYHISRIKDEPLPAEMDSIGWQLR